jgi:2Fe-2S ferredoxin
MGGSNPYNEKVETVLPTKAYKIKVVSEDDEVLIDVDPNKLPYNPSGLKGSLLEIMLGNAATVDHACGGVCACSTCHVYVESGLSSCNEANDDEEDMLDDARSVKPHSRLACQCVPDGSEDMVIRIPSWNRNLVSEEH